MEAAPTPHPQNTSNLILVAASATMTMTAKEAVMDTSGISKPGLQSPSREARKTLRTDQKQQPQDSLAMASFLLRPPMVQGSLPTPRRVSQALHNSPLGKYILEGKTRSLGNGSVLVVVVWEQNLHKLPPLQESPVTLGEWQATGRRAEREGDKALYTKVGPMAENTNIDKIRSTLRSLDESDIEISLIPA